MGRLRLHIGRTVARQFAALKNLPARLFWLFGLLPGVIKYLVDRLEHPHISQ